MQKTDRQLVMDLSLLVARMARRMSRCDGPTVHDAGNRAMAEQAVSYLQRHGLISPLRDAHGVSPSGSQTTSPDDAPTAPKGTP